MKKHKTALLEFFLTENEIFSFIIRPNSAKDGIEDKEPIVLKSAVGNSTVLQLVQDIRAVFERTHNRQVNINNTSNLDWQVTEQILGRLNDIVQLIFTEELLQFLSSFDALYLVPFGQLHYLPIHAGKLANGKYLIDQFKIAYLPSASVLQYLQKADGLKENNQLNRAYIVGVDFQQFSRFFENEARVVHEKIASLDNWESTFHCRQAANKQNIIQHSDSKKLVHISSHGYFSTTDALESGALLHRTITEDFDPTKKEHLLQALTAKDIFQRMKLKADLVVLSACVTGESENRPGDELIGLTRALLFAGTKSMIVTLFPTFKNITGHLESQRQRTLFAHFYELWLEKNYSKAEALQRFCQAIRQEKGYENPFYWFSYILVGNMY